MDDDEERETEKVPRILIIDLTLVTGMDTSTVDVFSDIRNLCKKYNCKLFVAGTSLNLRSVLSIGGFKADSGVRSKRQLRFFGSLDSALGKAEDMLLASEVEESRRTETMVEVSHRRLRRDAEHGFHIALCHIDEEVCCGYDECPTRTPVSGNLCVLTVFVLLLSVSNSTVTTASSRRNWLVCKSTQL